MRRTNSKNGKSTLDNRWSLCYENLWDAVFMECGHGGIWYEWAWTLIKVDQRWHFCRKDILSIFKVDLASLTNNWFKVLTVTVVDETSLHRSLLLLNQEDFEEESKGYYSEEESKFTKSIKKQFSESWKQSVSNQGNRSLSKEKPKNQKIRNFHQKLQETLESPHKSPTTHILK